MTLEMAQVMDSNATKGNISKLREAIQELAAQRMISTPTLKRYARQAVRRAMMALRNNEYLEAQAEFEHAASLMKVPR